ncbi:hypothetical protein AWJ20_941 [Sugiyamaella lignohabitans]|uniref:RING-type domain-containing protein n=1 Tax=Sugiyamaella lignohabitans TaxID=796027 RepID=A0A161HJ47_9ASCO|nr:uncharacterized protein AWJ20_941 [Sugiyamaella lignohabitans]ANB12677.1 hypothetical protein AWJ20_941 [Sugiyamaella lignohabitans]
MSIPSTLVLVQRAVDSTASAVTSSITAAATTSAHASASLTSTASASQTSGSGGDSSSQTPFLYFIALGLGIVFTNIWVVLGLKYCFRARRRNAMIARGEIPDEDSFTGDDIGFYMNPLLAPEFSRRRRRERRLMKFEELNERFPVQKYKVWGAEREKLGLSTEGGISHNAAIANSRPASIVEATTGTEDEMAEVTSVHVNNGHSSSRPSVDNGSRDITDLAAQSRRASIDGGIVESIRERQETPSTDESKHVTIMTATSTSEAKPESKKAEPQVTVSTDGEPKPVRQQSVATINHQDTDDESDPEAIPTTSSSNPHDDNQIVPPTDTENKTENDHDDEHEHEHGDDESVHSHFSPDNTESGDVCAVCLDSIEPDHDIRALGCNHVFHDECITPWLTTRRASCPLCKMDFSSARYRQETAAQQAELGAAAGTGADRTGESDSAAEQDRRDIEANLPPETPLRMPRTFLSRMFFSHGQQQQTPAETPAPPPAPTVTEPPPLQGAPPPSVTRPPRRVQYAPDGPYSTLQFH